MVRQDFIDIQGYFCDHDKNEIVLESYNFLSSLLHQGKNRQGVAEISHLNLSIIFRNMK